MKIDKSDRTNLKLIADDLKTALATVEENLATAARFVFENKPIQPQTADNIKPVFRMPYESYAILRALVDQRQEKLVERYRSALDFIPAETPKRDVTSSMDKAHEIFRKENAILNQVKEDLHQACQATYKDHPNPGMRKFWGYDSTISNVKLSLDI